MARAKLKTKNKAGKPYRCCRCSEPIIAGQGYYVWKFRYGGKYMQHATHGAPKPSQLTQSKMSGAYSAIEAAEDAINAAATADDIASALNDCASSIEDVRSEYEEGLDNMPDGLREAAESGETGERMQALEEFKDSLESAASDIESEEFEAEEPGEDVPLDEAAKALAEKKQEWLDDLKQRASDALGEFSL